MKRKILIAAGGTGGHLLPAQELGQLLIERHGCEVLFAGYRLSKSPFFKREKFAFCEVASTPLKKNPLLLAFSLLRGFLASIILLLRVRPRVVVGFGSYHTAPILFAAALLGKKIVLYESNRVVGKVNRWIAPFAKAIALQLPLIGGAVKRSVQVPLFPWIEKKNNLSKAEARREYGLDGGRMTILVFGGSQGAEFLNRLIPTLPKGQWQVIHLAGNEEEARIVRAAYREADIAAAVKGYETNMDAAYRAADLAICRSGAGTTAELIRYHLPSILIPYPHAADDHQRFNAEFLAERGGAVWTLQKDASVEKIGEWVRTLDLASMKLALAGQMEQHSSPVELDALVAKWGGWV